MYSRVEARITMYLLVPVLMVLLGVLFSGCTILPHDDRHEVTVHEGFWDHYDIGVRILWRGDLCAKRQIVMKRKAGLERGKKPVHVRATDIGCDDSIDAVRFREALDAERVGSSFNREIESAVYHVVPIPLQGRTR